MPLLIIEGKRYRVGDLTGEGLLWTIPVDEKKVTLELLRQSSAQPATLFVRTGGRVISVSIQRDENQHIYSLEVSGRPMTKGGLEGRGRAVAHGVGGDEDAERDRFA